MSCGVANWVACCSKWRCATAGAALLALREAPGVIDATIFGDKLHVLLHDAAEAADLPPLLAQQEHSSPARREPSRQAWRTYSCNWSRGRK